MRGYLENGNYYLLQAQNEENDLITRKENCDLAYKNFCRAQKETDCTARIIEIKYIYKELAQLFYCQAIENMDDVFFNKTACPDKLGDTSLEQLDLAINYFINAKECGINKDCEYLIKKCQQKKKQLNIKQERFF